VALNRALVETVGHMTVAEATQVLLRRAVLGEPQEVRDLAIAELKKRPMHAYVPQLIAAFPGKLKTKFHIYVLPGGMVLHEHEIFLEGHRADVSLTYESTINPVDSASAVFVTPRALASELQKAAYVEIQSRAFDDQNAPLRSRVQHVLERTTGFASVDDPALWERQYNDYHGWPTYQRPKPTYRRHYANSQSYFTAPTVNVTSIENHSCFPAGTLITAIDGQRAIETIKVGDRVLSQDPRTGELAYKPVQATTLRSATRMVQLAYNREAITATIGHPFWIAGSGWETANLLKKGDRVQTINGSVEIQEVAAQQPAEAYNLVVSDWHNYFVGEGQLLAHDNSPLEETTTLVPGLPAEVAGP
jgi:hypothetical protein